VCSVPEEEFTIQKTETDIADPRGIFAHLRSDSDRTRSTVRKIWIPKYDIGDELPIPPSEWHSEET
jgi:hypothetical protein